MSTENVQVRVLWMDDNVRTYNHVRSAIEVESAAGVPKGSLRISFTEGSKQRVVNIPLRNVRWWGTPGQEVAW